MDHFKFLKGSMIIAYKLDLPGEYNVSASFNVTDLSPFDVSDDLRTNFQEMGNDANQVAKTSQDPLSIHGGSMTRSRIKKMKEALNELIEHISSSNLVQDYNLPELSIQEGPCFLNVIQAS